MIAWLTRGRARLRPRPLHNVALLSAGSIAAKGFGLISFVISTHILHRAGYGDYSAVMRYVGLFAVATDLGLTTLAVRDIAQEPARMSRYVGNLLVLRLLLALATAGVCIVSSNFIAGSMGFTSAVRLGIIIWAFALIPSAASGAMSVVFQASERMAALSALTTATAAVTALLGSAVLLLGGRVVALVAAMAAVNALTAAAAIALAARRTEVRPRVDLSWWPVLLRAALPFAVLTLLNVLYSSADTLLLYKIKGAADSGLYSGAYRFVDVLLALAISPFNAAVLPAFNRIAAESRAAFQRLAVSGVRIMLIVSVPVAVATMMYPRVVLSVLGKDFMSAAPALQWLAWSFPCFMVLAILYNALYTVNRARDVAITFGVALVFNVSLNLLLIPRYSYVASAALTTASELLNVALAGWALYRHLGPIDTWAVAAKVGAAALAMTAVIWALAPLGILGGLPAGILVYLAILRLTRAIGPGERMLLARVPLAGRYAHLL